MIALVANASDELKRLSHTGAFGQLFTPTIKRSEYLTVPGLPWACDNDAFAKWSEHRYRAMLRQHQGQEGCLWVAAPDVVGDAAKTLALFNRWEPELREHGYPVALIAQDGLTLAAVPWARFDCLFIGGTTEFKLGAQARTLVGAAILHGKLVHAGRVNSARRIRYFHDLGVHSFDGTSLVRWPEVYLRRISTLLTNPQLSLLKEEAA